MKNYFQNSKAITLIALIITIVILIILAGVAISLTLGENGLMTKAKEANEAYKKAKSEEEISILLAEYKIENATRGIDLKTFLTEKEYTFEEDENGNIVLESENYLIVVNKNTLEVLETISASRLAKMHLSEKVVAKNGELKATLTFGEDVDVSKCKYVFTQEETISSENGYTEVVPSSLEINLPTNNIGKYYFHLLVVYKDGSKIMKKESASIGVPVTEIALNEINKTVTKLDTFTLSISQKNPENGTIESMEWTSSNNNIATVDENGNVETKAVGTAVITLKVNENENVKASCTVIVNPILAQSITISPSTVTVEEGSNVTLSATVSPNTADNQNIIWSSSNEDIATVDNNGVVTGVSAGNTTIAAKTADGTNIIEECDVTVTYQTYTISYVMNSGTNNSNNPTSYTRASNTITLQAPTRNGFLFSGWTYSGQTTPTKLVTIPTGSEGNKTFTANWEPVRSGCCNFCIRIGSLWQLPCTTGNR